jgi:hypothetical protein
VLLINPSYAKSEATQAIVERFKKRVPPSWHRHARSAQYQSNQSAFINRLLSYDKHNVLVLINSLQHPPF